jgi:acyl-CoA synthetase (AMP-forming)/AMP-acid ligase II/acyl carrier protein
MAAGALPTILSHPSVKQSRETFVATFEPILKKSAAPWIVCSAAFRDLIDEDAIEVIPPPARVIDDSAATTTAPLAIRRAGPDLFLQFSSGTTGLRKGVVVSEMMLAAQAEAFAERVGLTRQDRVASWLPLYHDMGLVGALLLPLYHGLTSIHLSPFDWLREPDKYPLAISSYRATITFLPNFAFGFLCRRVDVAALLEAGASLQSLRLVVNCSEPVRASAHREFAAAFAPLQLSSNALHASYAMAESTFAVTQTLPGRTPNVDRVKRDVFLHSQECAPADDSGEAFEFVSCGPPITGVEVRIEGAPGERHVGEIAVRGPCVFGGYFGAEQATGTEDGWFKTGDLGYLAGGELYVTGRAKDIIIHRGINIWPNDIEEIIGRVEGCKPGRVVVFGVPDERSETEDLVAVVEPDTENASLMAQLNSRIREAVNAQFGVRLADVVLSADTGLLKKSTSGKLSRRATREAYLAAKAQAPKPRDGTKYYGLVAGVSLACEIALPNGERLRAPEEFLQFLYELSQAPHSLAALRSKASLGKFGPLLERLLATRTFIAQSGERVDRQESGSTGVASSPVGDTPKSYVLAEGVRLSCIVVLPSGETLLGPPGETISSPLVLARFIRTFFEPPRSLDAITKRADRCGFGPQVERMIRAGAIFETGGGDYQFAQDDFAAFLPCPASKDLVIQFRAGLSDVIDGVPSQEFAQLTGIASHNLLMLRDQSSRYYVHGVSADVRTLEEIIAWLRGTVWALKETMGIERVHCVGTSMGAFAAMMVGHAIGANNVWAFSPSPPDEEWRATTLRTVAESNQVTEYGVWYGSEHPEDREFAEALGACPRVLIHPFPTESHLIASELWRAKQLPRLLTSVQTKQQKLSGTQHVSVDAVMQLVKRVAPSPGIAIERDTPLAGILDSFAVTHLFVLLEKRFGVRLDRAEISQADITDVERLVATVQRSFRAG